MTVFDLAVLGLIGASVLLAMLRGLVRSLVSLFSWVVALLLALQWGPTLAAALPADAMPAVAAQALAFAVVFLAVVIVGALVGLVIARLLHAVGLGPVDRVLGGVFGFGRGLLLVLVGVMLAGLTTLPRQDWWQNSRLADPLARIVLSLAPYLPSGWAAQLDFSATGKAPVPGPAADPRQQRT